MGNYKPKPHDPKDDPSRDRDQKQSNLRGAAIVPQVVTQTLDGAGGDIAGDTASGVQAHADAAITQDAFTQTITQGANIQFNSITMNVTGHDLQDSHDLG